jgi:hypothetical protein
MMFAQLCDLVLAYLTHPLSRVSYSDFVTKICDSDDGQFQAAFEDLIARKIIVQPNDGDDDEITVTAKGYKLIEKGGETGVITTYLSLQKPAQELDAVLNESWKIKDLDTARLGNLEQRARELMRDWFDPADQLIVDLDALPQTVSEEEKRTWFPASPEEVAKGRFRSRRNRFKELIAKAVAERVAREIREFKAPNATKTSTRRRSKSGNERKFYIRAETVHMAEKHFENKGNAGIVGEVQKIDQFQQLWLQSESKIDLSSLSSQLGTLRRAMKDRAKDEEPDHDAAIGAIASAESEAKKGNGSKALEYLATAGKWALDIAKEIGVSIAASAIEKATGMG